MSRFERDFVDFVAYGEMYATNASINVAIAATNTAYEVASGLTSGFLWKMGFGGAHYLDVLHDGIYLINWSMSLDSSGAGTEIEGGIMVDGVYSDRGTAHTTVPAGSAGSCIAGSLIAPLSPHQISLYVRNHTNTNTVVVEHAALTMVRVGRYVP